MAGSKYLANDVISSPWSLWMHEGAHAGVGVALGRKLRYVTVRGQCCDGQTVWQGSRSREWLTAGALSAVGIIAEELNALDSSGWAHQGPELGALRKELVRDAGRDDLHQLRDTAWDTWIYAHSRYAHLLSPAVDPSWSPVDIAEACWRYGAATLVARWAAVQQVAEALGNSPRALTSREVTAIVDAVPPDPDAASELPEEHARPWFLEHSRLKWMPSEKWLARETARVA